MITLFPQTQARTVKQQPRVMAALAACGRGSFCALSGSEGRAPHGSPSPGQCQGPIPGFHSSDPSQGSGSAPRSQDGGGGAITKWRRRRLRARGCCPLPASRPTAADPGVCPAGSGAGRGCLRASPHGNDPCGVGWKCTRAHAFFGLVFGFVLLFF